jgi:hypothetical protein
MSRWDANESDIVTESRIPQEVIEYVMANNLLVLVHFLMRTRSFAANSTIQVPRHGSAGNRGEQGQGQGQG